MKRSNEAPFVKVHLMKFNKYHALGNDYLVIPDDKGIDLSANPNLIRRICHRQYGLGADGVLLGPLETNEADFRLRIFNPDGSEAEKSGNGLRIFTRWLWDQGYIGEEPVLLQTKSGVVRAQVLPGGEMITVEMGRISFESQEIPVLGSPREVLNEKFTFNGQELLFCAATIGNPHCIIICNEVKTDQVKQLGPLIEHALLFPNRTNVQFMQIADREKIYIEIWERGAGYTLASGSSSCAAAATANRLGFCDEHITVCMPGGSMDVIINPDQYVNLIGPVRRVAEGFFFEEFFSDKIMREEHHD
jgi:diaminopimelate epimerase